MAGRHSSRGQVRRDEIREAVGSQDPGTMEVIVETAFDSDYLEKSLEGFGKRCDMI